MAKIGGWEIDTQTERAVWTEALYHIHNVTEDYQPTLSHTLEFYPPEARRQLEDAMNAAMKTGSPFDMKLPFISSDNRNLWIHIMGKAESPGNTITKISGIFQDITELHKAEEALRSSNQLLQDTIAQLREAQEQLVNQERMNAIAQLIGGLAHEFNNMMASVILFAEMMLRTSNLSSVDRERVTAIHEQAKRAAHITQQLLDFSRRATLWKKVVDVATFMTALTPNIKRILPDTITVKIIDESTAAMKMYVDAERIHQAILNMVYNARDAMPTGGKVTIRVRPFTLSPEEKPPVPDMEPSNWIEFGITDTGTGINAEALPHIFEPFFTTRAPMRSGLGLSQVLGTITQHDGYITVETEPGQGSTFLAYLPAHKELYTTETNKLEEPLTLIIEEHDLVRDALAAAVESLNYNYVAIAKPKQIESLTPTQTSRTNSVLSDITDMRGHIPTFVKEMKEHFPNVVVILIGEGQPRQEITMLIEGDHRVKWLKKPVDLAKLAEALADLGLDNPTL
jgi:signal transduction histidine kinase